MTVLLTHGYFLEEDQKEQTIMRPYPPLGLLYLSSYLEAHSIQNEIFDTTFSSKEKLFQHIDNNHPAIVGIYVNLMTKPNVLKLIDHIKKSNSSSRVILGGPEVTHNIKNFLENGADYIVVGEGEQTMLELVNLLQSSEIENRIESIDGIAYMRNGVIKNNKNRTKLADLDQLPIPNRNKIDLSKYLKAWKEHHGQNAISVSTMRGCPYTCKWCSRAVYGLSYRRRSPRKVVEELMHIKKKYNPDTIWFVDDVFTINYRWLRTFNQLIKDQEVKIRYECITRADRLNEEVIQLLKSSGCFRVWIGAESGSQDIIDKMDRRVDVTTVRDMIHLTQSNQIEAGTFIMLGYPGETEKDIELTIDHLKKSNPDHFTITLAYPIKGTEFHDEIADQVTTQLDWSTSTDREIDFKRTYHRKYYDYAVRRVINEVKYFQSQQEGMRIDPLKFRLKSIAAKTGMFLIRTLYK